MADKHSFDIVSEVNLQEVANAVDQAQREIANRYDFRDTHAAIEFDRKTPSLKLTADHDKQLEAVRKVLIEKFVKRGVEPRAMDPQKIEHASHDTVRQEVKFKSGIDRDLAKTITQKIKDLKLKVSTAIQGPAIRVSGAKKDELQTVIAALRASPPGDLPLQFTNYR